MPDKLMNISYHIAIIFIAVTLVFSGQIAYQTVAKDTPLESVEIVPQGRSFGIDTIVPLAPGIPLIITLEGNGVLYAPTLEIGDVSKIGNLQVIVIDEYLNGWVMIQGLDFCLGNSDELRCDWNEI